MNLRFTGTERKTLRKHALLWWTNAQQVRVISNSHRSGTSDRSFGVDFFQSLIGRRKTGCHSLHDKALTTARSEENLGDPEKL